jgi:hypothetical protein
MEMQRGVGTQESYGMLECWNARDAAQESYGISGPREPGGTPGPPGVSSPVQNLHSERRQLVAFVRCHVPVVGRGHASLLTNSEIWHSKRVRDTGCL